MTNVIDPNQVALREITADTVITIVRLSVSEDQKKFVAPNAVSLAQALFAPETWCPGCPEPFAGCTRTKWCSKCRSCRTGRCSARADSRMCKLTAGSVRLDASCISLQNHVWTKFASRLEAGGRLPR